MLYEKGAEKSALFFYSSWNSLKRNVHDTMTKYLKMRLAITVITLMILVISSSVHASCHAGMFTRGAFKAYSLGEDRLKRYLEKNNANNQDCARVFSKKGHQYYAAFQYDDARKSYFIALSIYKSFNDFTNQGHILVNLADIYQRMGDNKKALEKYGLALSLLEKTTDPDGRGKIFRSMGDIHMRTGENLKALGLYQDALTLYTESDNSSGRGNVYRSIGDLFLRTRDYQKAIEMYDKALSLLKNHDVTAQARVLRSKGEIFRRTGDNTKAVEFYQKALTLHRRANDYLGQADVYRSLGEIHYYKSDNVKALEMYNRALDIFIKAKEPNGQGYVYWRTAQVYLRMGDNVKVLEMLKKALPLFQMVDDPIGLGEVFFDLGHLDYYKRDYAKALEMYEKASPYYLRANEPIGQGDVLRGIGYIYLRTGDFARALTMCEKALPHYIRANYPLGQANTYWSMGEAYFNLNNYPKAMEMYDKALPLYQGIDEPIGQGIVYQNRGEIYLKNGDFSKAVSMNEKALLYYTKAESVIDQVKAYKNLGDIFGKMADNNRALEMYELALRLSRKIEDIESEAYVSVKIAGVMGREGKVSEAVHLYDIGLAKFERVRRLAGFAEMKKSYMEKIYDLYEDAAVFMLENQFNDKAFQYIEAMKARVFLDQLSEGRVDLEKGVDKDLKEKRDALEKGIQLVRKQLVEASQKAQPDTTLIVSLKQKHVTMEEDLEAIKREIRYKNPLYASVQYPEPISLTELQKNILKTDEVILEYFLSPKGTYCLVVSKDRYEIVKLAIGQEILEKDINEFRRNIQGVVTGEEFQQQRLISLYGYLIKPIEAFIKDKTLIIIPHGVLANLPFESLVMKDQQGAAFLIEQYRVKYVQSASVLGILRTQYKRDGLSDKFIGFGDPVYDYENFKFGKPEKGSADRNDTEDDTFRKPTKRGYTRAGGNLDRLVGSGKEVESISGIFRDAGKGERILLRIQAKEEYAKDRTMEDYGYIHFSTHGILDADFQAIAFSQVPGSRDDGFLTLVEIMNIRYHAHLIVLAACETGLGESSRGEGVTGLTRAVMYAGSPAAVVSLWSVSDEGTKDLMVMFYENMVRKGMAKDDALRAAKIEMIRLGSNTMLKGKTVSRYMRSHPFFWSAFVMYGE